MGGKIVFGDRDSAGREYMLAPVPFNSGAYMEGISWGKLGTPEQAAAKQEISRVLQCYERFGAWQQPIKVGEKGATVWEVRFPDGSKWQSGPRQDRAWNAVLQNYLRNQKFRGFMNMFGGNGDELFRMDSIIDAALDRDDQKLEEVESEKADREAFENRRAEP